MSSLANQQQNLSFPGLLQVPGGITTALQTVQDGNGNPTGLQISSSGINVSTSDSATVSVNGTQIPNTSPRLITDHFGDRVSVKDFGAVGDGVIDDTDAIQTAITYATTLPGKIIYFPAGTYIITSGLTVTGSVILKGEGSGYPGWTGFSASKGTILKYTGSAGATMLIITLANSSVGVEDISFDGDNSAANGIQLIGVVYGKFSNIHIYNCTNVGLEITGGSTTTASWNVFTNLSINAAPTSYAALWVRGGVTTGNACHNTFIGTALKFTGTAHGLVLGACDNNQFLNTYIWCPPTGVTGYGVYVDPTEVSNFPVNNSFTHLQASVRGWYQPATTTKPAAYVYGYMRDNGQPVPNLGVNGSLKGVFDNVAFTYALATAGGGWSGGTPTIELTYSISGIQISGEVTIYGTGIIAAANVVISGMPSIAFTPVTGFNVNSTAALVQGYISGGNLIITTGFASSNLVMLQFNAVL